MLAGSGRVVKQWGGARELGHCAAERLSSLGDGVPSWESLALHTYFILRLVEEWRRRRAELGFLACRPTQTFIRLASRLALFFDFYLVEILGSWFSTGPKEGLGPVGSRASGWAVLTQAERRGAQRCKKNRAPPAVLFRTLSGGVWAPGRHCGVGLSISCRHSS